MHDFSCSGVVFGDDEGCKDVCGGQSCPSGVGGDVVRANEVDVVRGRVVGVEQWLRQKQQCTAARRKGEREQAVEVEEVRCGSARDGSRDDAGLPVGDKEGHGVAVEEVCHHGRGAAVEGGSPLVRARERKVQGKGDVSHARETQRVGCVDEWHARGNVFNETRLRELDFFVLASGGCTCEFFERVLHVPVVSEVGEQVGMLHLQQACADGGSHKQNGNSEAGWEGAAHLGGSSIEVAGELQSHRAEAGGASEDVRERGKAACRDSTLWNRGGERCMRADRDRHKVLEYFPRVSDRRLVHGKRQAVVEKALQP